MIQSLGLNNLSDLVFSISDPRWLLIDDGSWTDLTTCLSRIYLLVWRWVRRKRDSQCSGWRIVLWFSGTPHSKIQADGVVNRRIGFGWKAWRSSTSLRRCLVWGHPSGMSFAPPEAVIRGTSHSNRSSRSFFQSGCSCPFFG